MAGVTTNHEVAIPLLTEEKLMEVVRKGLTQVKINEYDRVEIHLKALEDLVSVNSLFTMAVFVGLSFASPGQHSLEERTECDADAETEKKLVLFEVISFSCFFLSSLVAKVLKLYLNLYRFEIKALIKPHFDLKDLMMSLAGLASVLGIVFLTLSIVNVIQIRVGKMSCGSVYSIRAVAALCGIVGLGLCIYATSMANAIYISIKKDQEHATREQISHMFEKN